MPRNALFKSHQSSLVIFNMVTCSVRAIQKYG